MSTLYITGFNKEKLPENYWDSLRSKFDKVIFEDSKEAFDKSDVTFLLSKFNAVDRELISEFPNLKYIGVFGSGFGRVDTQFASERGIIVTNVPGYSTESVSEFTFGVILEELRQLSEAKKNAKALNLDESIYKASEINGKTFGILGFGKIGKQVSHLAKAFGAEVIYWSRQSRDNSNSAKFVELDELFSISDILSINIAKTDDTASLISQKYLDLMKPDVLVINTSPMEIFDYTALVNKLKKDQNFKLVMDHADELTEEELTKFKSHDNFVFYPPIGYISKEARDKLNRIFVENIISFIDGKAVNQVN